MDRLTQPEDACRLRWNVWRAAPRSAIGYRWHAQIDWRVRASGEFVTVSGVDRAKHLAMVRELRKMEPQGLSA